MNIGDEIPNFSVQDYDGETITRDDLLGSPFVLYFYPMDDTPGCTKEACEFRDTMAAFNELDVLVVGVSPDSKESHKKFVEKYELDFPLLSDETKAMAKTFGALKEDGSLIRTTFLCDEEGIIQWMEKPVKVEGHVERVLEAVEDAFA